MPDESVGFYFNVEKFFGSVSVQRMSFTEKGVYLVMLFQQWREKTKNLPDDPQATAEIIAVTPAQAADVGACWDVVRRKFVTSKHDPERIYNVEIENTRRKQRAYYTNKRGSGKSGGVQSGVKRREQRDLRAKQNEAVLQKTEAAAKQNEGNGEDRSSKERIGVERREIPRAHTGTVLEGSLPREHRDHVYCDPTFSICVPPAVHAKLIGPLSRKFDGDRQQAQVALLAWYAAVAERLPAECVMGDAFKFWQPRFDAEFATPLEPTPTGNKRIAGLMAGGAAFLNRERP